MQQPSGVFIPGCLSQGLTFATQRDFIYDPALLEISLCGVTFAERTSEVLANFSADMIVHTRWFLLGLSSHFHLFVQLKSNRDSNPTRSYEHLHSDIYRKMCVCRLIKINSSCPWRPTFNTDDAYILIFPAI